jgi:hypothetical protein
VSIASLLRETEKKTAVELVETEVIKYDLSFFIEYHEIIFLNASGVLSQFYIAKDLIKQEMSSF